MKARKIAAAAAVLVTLGITGSALAFHGNRPQHRATPTDVSITKTPVVTMGNRPTQVAPHRLHSAPAPSAADAVQQR